jgi:RimJ/RimL family protein N-acetyltransferase
LDQQEDVQKYIIGISLENHVENYNDPRIIYLTILNENEKISGYFILAVEDETKSIEFRRIVVDEKERGIGQKAIKKMEIFCKSDLKANRIWLDVFDQNVRGQHIYQKLGYVKFKESDHKGQKLYLYEKQL